MCQNLPSPIRYAGALPKVLAAKTQVFDAPYAQSQAADASSPRPAEGQKQTFAPTAPLPVLPSPGVCCTNGAASTGFSEPVRLPVVRGECNEGSAPGALHSVGAGVQQSTRVLRPWMVCRGRGQQRN